MVLCPDKESVVPVPVQMGEVPDMVPAFGVPVQKTGVQVYVRPLGGATVLRNRQRSVLFADAVVAVQSVVVVRLLKSLVVVLIPTCGFSLFSVEEVAQVP